VTSALIVWPAHLTAPLGQKTTRGRWSPIVIASIVPSVTILHLNRGAGPTTLGSGRVLAKLRGLFRRQIRR